MNISYRSILGIAAGCGLMLSTASCSQDFLEQYPSNSITEGNFYQNDNDFDQAVRGCYAQVKSNISFHRDELTYRGDESKQTAMAVSTQDRYDIDHFQPIANNGIVSDLWKKTYNGIYRCNDVLVHLNGRSDIQNAGLYRGECLFLRAWHYFTLYRVFGVVPVTKTVVAPADAKNIARCTEFVIY